MNIFALDKDPVVGAQMSCDKHIVKMILEKRSDVVYKQKEC